MFSQLESLIVFSQSQSMADAAVRLRVSQSALSKRIRSLENNLGFTLLEHHGRKAVLTPAAQTLLNNVEPLVAQLTDVLNVVANPSQTKLSIALADAIMVSWGAQLMAELKLNFPDIEFELHSHRTATVIERLSRGRYQIGLCTGLVPESDGLMVMPLLDEPMAIVIAEPLRERFDQWIAGDGDLEVVCIEEKSAMWRFLEPHFEAWRLRPQITIESSVGAARLAVEGFCHALVPCGVAKVIAAHHRTVNLDAHLFQKSSLEPLNRPCSVVSRKTVINHPAFSEVFDFIHQRAKFLN
jgi:DNA-binding transcriptional LysR family regulator